ncbi:MAG: hypothetical protein ABI831_05620 [Betaproteobacteria bacterium]
MLSPSNEKESTMLPQSTLSTQRSAPMGRLVFVVETRHGESLDIWYVLCPDRASAMHFEAQGISISPGCHVVVDAKSLRPVGILEPDLPPAPLPAGYNPYFDLPAV